MICRHLKVKSLYKLLKFATNVRVSLEFPKKTLGKMKITTAAFFVLVTAAILTDVDAVSNMNFFFYLHIIFDYYYRRRSFLHCFIFV